MLVSTIYTLLSLTMLRLIQLNQCKVIVNKTTTKLKIFLFKRLVEVLNILLQKALVQF